jgi:hypothetical protein
MTELALYLESQSCGCLGKILLRCKFQISWTMKHRGWSWNPMCVFTAIKDIYKNSTLSLEIKQPEHEADYILPHNPKD